MIRIELDSIGDRLKLIRKSKGYTQSEMADILNISFSTYRRYEMNKTPVPHTVLEILIKKTSASFDFLILGKDLVEDKNESMIRIRQNTQIDTKIENGNLIITTTIPLSKFIG